MVLNCCVYGCTSTSKEKNVQFHRFPRDVRCNVWIDACRRPDLKDKTIEQLYQMYVCSLHFERWMYLKKKLNSAAFPVLQLPPASLYSMSTQTETPEIKIVEDLHSRGFQKQIDTRSLGVSAVASTSNQSSQTEKTLTDQTSRKRELPEQVLTCAKKLKLMDDNKSTDVSRQQFLQGCDKFLSPNLSKIVKAQTNLKPKGSRYSKEFKLFCLNIYYSSPHAYKFLSKTLCLPSKSTLATVAIPMDTKISDYIWGVLSQAIKHFSPLEKECTLCMDEMSLKCSLFYDTDRDKIIGIHEIDGSQGSYAAGYAFTMLLRGILGNWKQVIGYAFLTTSKIDEQLEKWIMNTVKQLFALGFKIRAIVSNQGSEFLKFSKSRGISEQHPYFEIDGKKIYYIFDVPHLIKSVRNTLMNYNLEFNGKTASWDDIYECYQLDKQKDVRCAPKLTDSHISPNSFQKQKVRLATQVLSNSVKVAVETYTKAGDLKPRDGTVELIDTMDKLFDLFNSSNLSSPKPYNKPYRDNELQKKLLLKAQNLLKSLIVRHKHTGKDVTNSIKFIHGFSVTINAISQLYHELKTESGRDEFYLLTCRLNNDSFENVFGIIRQAGGNCREPTCVQFERAFRKSFLCQIFQLCNKSNGTDDFDNVLSQYSDYIQNKSLFTHKKSSVVNGPITQTFLTQFDIPGQNTFLYVCGYLLRRCLDKHKCLSMINYASSYAEDPTTSNFNLRKHAYNTKRGSLVGLPATTTHHQPAPAQPPPADFVKYCCELENNFKQNFCSFAGNQISRKLFDELRKVEFKSRPCSCFPNLYLVKLFIRMRIHYVVKFNNRELKLSKNKISRKNLAVRHL